MERPSTNNDRDCATLENVIPNEAQIVAIGIKRDNSAQAKRI